MDRLPSALGPSLSWESLTFRRDSSGIDMATPPGGLPKWLGSHVLSAAVREIEQLSGGTAKSVMVNSLDPGKVVPIHTDEATGLRRYHLPLQTNVEAWWWDEEGGTVFMEAGYWWGPVPFTKRHQVSNNGNRPRVHLVVDVS